MPSTPKKAVGGDQLSPPALILGIIGLERCLHAVRDSNSGFWFLEFA